MARAGFIRNSKGGSSDLNHRRLLISRSCKTGLVVSGFIPWIVFDIYQLEACHQAEKEETPCPVALCAPAWAMYICRAATAGLEASIPSYEKTHCTFVFGIIPSFQRSA